MTAAAITASVGAEEDVAIGEAVGGDFATAVGLRELTSAFNARMREVASGATFEYRLLPLFGFISAGEARSLAKLFTLTVVDAGAMKLLLRVSFVNKPFGRSAVAVLDVDDCRRWGCGPRAATERFLGITGAAPEDTSVGFETSGAAGGGAMTDVGTTFGGGADVSTGATASAVGARLCSVCLRTRGGRPVVYWCS